MKVKLSINERTQISWMPKIFTANGFKGEAEYLANAATIVLFHPQHQQCYSSIVS